jgi:hypothetical protein
MPVFGRIFVYRKLSVFKINVSKVGFETASKIKVDVRLAKSDDVSKLVKLKQFRKEDFIRDSSRS